MLSNLGDAISLSVQQNGVFHGQSHCIKSQGLCAEKATGTKAQHECSVSERHEGPWYRGPLESQSQEAIRSIDNPMGLLQD